MKKYCTMSARYSGNVLYTAVDICTARDTDGQPTAVQTVMFAGGNIAAARAHAARLGLDVARAYPCITMRGASIIAAAAYVTRHVCLTMVSRRGTRLDWQLFNSACRPYHLQDADTQDINSNARMAIWESLAMGADPAAVLAAGFAGANRTINAARSDFARSADAQTAAYKDMHKAGRELLRGNAPLLDNALVAAIDGRPAAARASVADVLKRDADRKTIAAIIPALTHRQRQILQGMYDGLTQRDIAARLRIASHGTLTDHVKAIRRAAAAVDPARAAAAESCPLAVAGKAASDADRACNAAMLAYAAAARAAALAADPSAKIARLYSDHHSMQERITQADKIARAALAVLVRCPAPADMLAAMETARADMETARAARNNAAALAVSGYRASQSDVLARLADNARAADAHGDTAHARISAALAAARAARAAMIDRANAAAADADAAVIARRDTDPVYRAALVRAARAVAARAD